MKLSPKARMLVASHYRNTIKECEGFREAAVKRGETETARQYAELIAHYRKRLAELDGKNGHGAGSA